MAKINKILIANRGEIAVRIMRTARDLGYRTVAAYSEADAGSPHVALADEAVLIGPPPPRDSYLSIERLLEAAARTGADALHPGYGFLAENAELAARCEAAGITFIGPPAEAIRLMGDKAEAKMRMEEAGVPCVPGYLGEDQEPEAFARQAERMGFPLLVKAIMGGGGRGMRVVRSPAELEQTLASARSEAQGAFGNGDLLLERLIEDARHVEIQVFADTLGDAVHLGERECSVQRRHQKIIEESPSPAVDEELRGRMCAAALAAARAIGYVGAGTVEFLLDRQGGFYFMEMNTRLQVEHPVTELVTGLDLVAWQLQVAAGGALPLAQEEITFRGHAVEARIYAEDPAAGFLPQAGRVLVWRPVAGRQGVRVDSGVVEGQEVPPHYDPMIAKVIAHGPDRETARRRLAAALEDSVLLGPANNRAFLVDLLRDEAFAAGEVTTATLDRRFAAGPPARPAPPAEAWALAALVHSLQGAGWPRPWRSAGAAEWPLTLTWRGQEQQLRVGCPGDGRFSVAAGERRCELRLVSRRGPALRVEVDGVQRDAWFARDADGTLLLELGGRAARFREPTALREEPGASGAGGEHIDAPVSGGLIALLVQPGQRVEPGQRVAVIEAMKMEHPVTAGVARTVAGLCAAQGDQVTAGQRLITLAPQEPGDTGGEEEG